MLHVGHAVVAHELADLTIIQTNAISRKGNETVVSYFYISDELIVSSVMQLSVSDIDA